MGGLGRIGERDKRESRDERDGHESATLLSAVTFLASHALPRSSRSFIILPTRRFVGHDHRALQD
jgi:hypothetical protein